MKIDTYLPIFNGFYGTFFEPEEGNEISEINDIREANGLELIDYDDCEFDYDDYSDRVARACVSEIENELRHLFGVVNIEFQDIYSPKYYNFENDSINVEIDIDGDKLMEYLHENMDAFRDYLKEQYSSYDGFIPKYPNTPEGWLSAIANEDEDELKHMLGATLQFVLNNEGYEDNDLYEAISSEAYITAINYEELTNK